MHGCRECPGKARRKPAREPEPAGWMDMAAGSSEEIQKLEIRFRRGGCDGFSNEATCCGSARSSAGGILRKWCTCGLIVGRLMVIVRELS
eukprot:1507472-Rhodomonas_salina.1